MQTTQDKPQERETVVQEKNDAEVKALLDFFKDLKSRFQANFLWRWNNRAYYRINFWNHDMTDAVILNSAFVYIEPTNSKDEWVIENATLSGKKADDVG